MALLFPAVLFAQEVEQPKSQRGRNVNQQMRLRHQQLGLEQREAEVEFDRQMKELELKQRRIELERRRNLPRRLRHFRHHRCRAMMLLFVIGAFDCFFR